jgi:hypothetical protein
MDVRCKVCGEPWALDTLHEEVQTRKQAGEKATYQSVAAEFRAVGCKALREVGADDCSRRTGGTATVDEAIQALYDINGEDMDGAAAGIEDLEMMGRF